MLTDLYLFSTNFNYYFLREEKKNSPFKDLYDLKDLGRMLTSKDSDLDQWISWKREIKAFVAEHANNLEELDEFFTTITEWGIECNPQKILVVLVEIVSLDILIDVIRFKEEDAEIPFENIFDLAAENAPLCPEPPDHSMTARVKAEWKKYRPIIIYFIPNLINIFLGAFNFLDSHKKYTTLWEKYLLLEIIYKFFIVPYCLIKILQPVFVVTAKVYLVAALIIVGVGILVSCYQRWFRPIPDEIVNCTNLDKQMEVGGIEPKVGQAKEIERLIAALEVDANVLLVGLSGEGKTALMHHFIGLKHQGKLSEKLQQLTVYEVDCGLMISSVSYGHSELINQIKDQTDGYEGKILLFFDEFDQIAANHGAFQAFKKRFLEDKPHSKFIATMTFKEFEKLKTLDIDSSFRRRIVPIFVQSNSDEQNRWIIQDLVNREAKDIPVTDDAIEAVLEISAMNDYLPEIGRPAKAIKILMDAIGICRAGYNPHYISVELSEARQDYQALKLQAIREIKASSETLKNIREVKARIEKLEKNLNQNRKRVQKIKRMISDQQKMNADYYRLTHLFAKVLPQKVDPSVLEDVEIPFDLEAEIFDESKDIDLEADISDESKDIEIEEVQSSFEVKNSKELMSQNDQVMYLWYYFYAFDALKKLLNSEIDKVKSQIPIQVDADLIYQIYEESKEIEKHLFDDQEEGRIKSPHDDENDPVFTAESETGRLYKSEDDLYEIQET